MFQSPVIKYDKHIYDVERKKATNAKTSQLPDELGQVEFILSDKTGTLTKNNMILNKISVGDEIYTVNQISEYLKKRYKFDEKSSDHSPNSPNDNNSENSLSNISNNSNQIGDKIENQISEKIDLSELELSPCKINRDENSIIELFRLVNICNSIVIDYSQSTKSNQINYQSSSIDELALVNGSLDCGVTLKDKTISNIKIDFFNKFTEVWEILAILPFDSERKHMSVIAKSKITGEISLYSKGADEVIFCKLKQDIKSNNLKNAIEINDIFARQGLRTLVMGKKVLSPEYFANWFAEYNAILNNMNMSKYEKYEELNRIFDIVEEGMTYIGSSAIEDKLQDDLPETIGLLKEANINIWMLTGDKIENSIEIAKLCGLIGDKTEYVYFTLSNVKNIEEFEKLLDGIQLIDSNIDPDLNRNITKNSNLSTSNNMNTINNGSISNKTKTNNTKITIDSLISKIAKQSLISKKYCLILDGKTLCYFERLSSKYQELFINIIVNSYSAICCRLTPKQKSQIVKILKNLGKVILSIGDGANDTPMIIEANIGIGISGKEGSYAVRSADFSMTQFRFLKDLILTHGRLAYKRISTMTCYAFYKNIIVVFSEIYFIALNGFSGQIFFSDWFTNFYNLLWSSWPLMINYAQDRDLDRDVAIKYPVLYTAGHRNYYMNKKTFWSWIFFALYHGAMIFWVPMLVSLVCIVCIYCLYDFYNFNLFNILSLLTYFTTDYYFLPLLTYFNTQNIDQP